MFINSDLFYCFLFRLLIESRLFLVIVKVLRLYLRELELEDLMQKESSGVWRRAGRRFSSILENLKQ